MKKLFELKDRIKESEPEEKNGSQLIKNENAEAGFSLIEVTCAMVILLTALLGVFVSFVYSVNYNAGNSSRSQALAVLQQEIEKMRSRKFTPDFTDPELYGGVKTTRSVTMGGNRFSIDTTIDNNPLTPTVIESDESARPSIKQITVSVTLESPTPGWQTAIPAKIILQRVRGN